MMEGLFVVGEIVTFVNDAGAGSGGISTSTVRFVFRPKNVLEQESFKVQSH